MIPAALLLVLTASADPTPPVDAALIELATGMAGRVATQRNLPLREPLDVRIEDEATLRARTRDDFEEEDAQRELAQLTAAYRLLRVLPPDFDLGQAYLDVLTEHVAGYYDPESRHLALIQRPTAFHDAGLQSMSEDALTIAHEVVHALQDQHFDLWSISQRTHNSDVGAAIQALIEGDANLSMLYFGFGDALPASAVQDFIEAGYDLQHIPADSALARLPRVFQAGLVFPYATGTDFALAVFASGGYAALDAAFSDPPLSTEQILHPRRYLAAQRDHPQDTSLPNLESQLGPGWEASFDDVMGELGILLLFEEVLGPGRPGIRAAARGWGGDRLAVYQRPVVHDSDAEADSDAQRLAGVWVTKWDTPQDAASFYGMSQPWLRATFPDYTRQRGVLTRHGRCSEVIRRGRTEVQVLLDVPCDARLRLRRPLRDLDWAPVTRLQDAGEVKPRPPRSDP